MTAWVQQFDGTGCGIASTSRGGNEFGIRYTRRSGLSLAVRAHGGPPFGSIKTWLTLTFLDLTAGEARISDRETCPPIAVEACTRNDDPLLCGAINGDIVNKLAQPQ